VLDVNGAVDTIKTQAERERARDERLNLPVELANDDELDGTRRRITLSPATAARAGVAEGDLVELSNLNGAAALRGWAHVGETDEAIRLGPLAIAALATAPGEAVELRALKATVA
jgi:anaerobic selenocysteine-containing dehydrogenase